MGEFTCGNCGEELVEKRKNGWGGSLQAWIVADPHLLVPEDHTHVCKPCLAEAGRVLADCTEETEPDYEAMVADYSNRFEEFGVTR